MAADPYHRSLPKAYLNGGNKSQGPGVEKSYNYSSVQCRVESPSPDGWGALDLQKCQGGPSFAMMCSSSLLAVTRCCILTIVWVKRTWRRKLRRHELGNTPKFETKKDHCSQPAGGTMAQARNRLTSNLNLSTISKYSTQLR